MTRRLPWKTSNASPSLKRTQPHKQESPSIPAASSPKLPDAPPSLPQTPFKKARRERVLDSGDGVRSPSTSPPPEVPVERFMIPGPLHDDRYRMVEDELVNIARQFTTHLHRAEYNRLKSLAKAQNAATIREIERPVVGTPTLLARQRHDNARLIAKQRKVLRTGGRDSATDLRRVPTGLQGLMESPRKETKWISAAPAGTTTTRAAAGFQSNMSSPSKPRASPQRASMKKRRLPRMDDDTTEGSDDEPATPSRKPMTKPARVIQTPSAAPARSVPWSKSTPKATGSSSRDSAGLALGAHRSRFTPAKAGPSRESHTTKQNDENGDVDDDDPFGINKRRIRRQQSKEQFRTVEQRGHPNPKKPTPDTIPSFM
ncbi:hypothetical protein QQX98_004498 [Neonectria punicea]|uniref:Borealin N-terminal domain-containing protein n=1 Tax=Neonectria punicea TaxID=979145 RepID=A0ABR1H8T9_9HYPO